MLPNASYISFILWVLINIGHIEDWIGMVIIRVLFCSDGYSLVFVKIAYELVFNAAKSLALLRHPSHTGAPFLSEEEEGKEERKGRGREEQKRKVRSQRFYSSATRSSKDLYP